MKRAPKAACIPASAGKPPLRSRPLIDDERARELARLFSTLSNETRLRLLHLLHRAEEICVTDIAAELRMTPQAISNQLQRLSDRHVVAARREGTHLFYRLADPCVPGLLDLGLCLLEESETEEKRTKKRKRSR